MTTLSTPLSLGGSGALPAIEEIAERHQVARSSRLFLGSFIAVVCLLAALFIGFHAYAAWALSHPEVAPLVSNPKLAKVTSA